MLFTDPLFLFYFFPLSLLVLRITAFAGRFNALARAVVVLSTLVFYAYGNLLWPILFLVVIGGVYFFAMVTIHGRGNLVRRAGVVGAVVYALCILGLFKYLNWLAALIPWLQPVKAVLVPYFGTAGQIILPPGISFFVFEALSFAIDAYRRNVHCRAGFGDYLVFLAMYPRFIAGPIVRYDAMVSQYDSWPKMNFNRGMAVFALGYAIKSLFADQFAVFVPYAFSVERPDLIQSWIGVVSYSMQLYFDFWGYSLMATGLGLCLGFSFPDNFRSPYRSVSITQFWQRWHMTLSQWLRDYLYISLGGNRCKPWRVYCNLFLTMVLGGLWHGANFTFIAWGAFHGVFLVIERAIGEERLATIPLMVRRAATLLIVMVGWVFFRSATFDQAGEVVAGLVGLHGLNVQFNNVLLAKHLPSVLLALGGLYFLLRIEPRVVGSTPMAERIFSARSQWILAVCLLVALLMSMSSVEIPFLYFQF